MNKPYTVGVTGGIGSGKTTVVKLFQAKNISIYIADEEAKKLMKNNEKLIQSIKDKFGEEFYTDGKLNKKYISNIVFKDNKKLKQLNHLVHPAVRNHFDLWKHRQKSPYVIYESALIFEHNQQHLFDEIILVTAPEKIRIERVKKRSGMSEKEIKQRIKHQLPDEMKMDYVNYNIENINIYELKKDIDCINEKIINNIKEKS